MLKMLARNRVEDFARWKRIFDAENASASNTGLRLKHLWRDIEDQQQVFFLFEVTDVDQARAYMADPRSAEVGVAAGVLDGEVYLLEEDDAI